MLKKGTREINLRMMNPTQKKSKRDRNVIAGRIYLPPEMWSWIRIMAEEENSSDGEIVENFLNRFMYPGRHNDE